MNIRNLLIQTIFLSIFCILSWFLYHEASPIQSHCDIDSKAYLEKGTLFYQKTTLAKSDQESQPYYSLGYPLFIGTIFKLFGPSIFVLILIQILLALISCLLIIRITKQIFGKTSCPYAFLFFAINVGYLVFSQFILTEILLSLLLTLFFERIVTFLKQNKLHQVCQSALALGISIVVKPAAIFFVLLLLPLFVFFIKGTLWKKFAGTILFAAFFSVPVIGYKLYIKNTFKTSNIATLGNVNLFYWFFPNVLAHELGTTANQERLKLLALSSGKHDFVTVAPLFWKKLKNKPFLFVYVWFLNVFKTMFGLYTTNLKVLVNPTVHGGDVSFFKTSGSIFSKIWNYISLGAHKKWIIFVGIFETIWSTVRYILCFFGLWILFRRKKFELLLLSLTFLGYFAFITGHDGCSRFRMMFEFLLVVLAAGGIDTIFQIPSKLSLKQN